MAKRADKKYSFSRPVTKLLSQLGGSFVKSSSSFENLMRSIELPPLHELEIIVNCLGEDALLELSAIYSPKTADSHERLVLFLQNKTKTFFHRCGDTVHLLGEGKNDTENSWGIDTPEAHIRETIEAEDLTMLYIGFWDGSYPDCFYVCLTDPNPSNPYIYATDHSCPFAINEIFYWGTFDEFLGLFIKPEDINESLIQTILSELESES